MYMFFNTSPGYACGPSRNYDVSCALHDRRCDWSVGSHETRRHRGQNLFFHVGAEVRHCGDISAHFLGWDRLHDLQPRVRSQHLGNFLVDRATLEDHHLLRFFPVQAQGEGGPFIDSNLEFGDGDQGCPCISLYVALDSIRLQVWQCCTLRNGLMGLGVESNSTQLENIARRHEPVP